MSVQRAWIALLAAALWLAACGGGGPGGSSGSTATPLPSTTATEPPPPASTSVPEVGARVWFMRGDRLAAATRRVPAAERLRAGLSALVAGPAADERENGLASMIPEATRLLGVTAAGPVATVDLSSAFASGGGSLSMRARVAQVVFTATEAAGIDRVAFVLDGRPVNAIGGEGVVVDPPVSRADFADLEAGWEPPATTAAPTPTVPPTTTEAPGTPSLPGWMAGREVEALPTTRKEAALTFDCGGNADGLSSILATLRSTHAPATFFLTGRWAMAFPDRAAAIGALYPVGNHSLRHDHLPALTASQARQDVVAAGRAVSSAAGRTPRPRFRFPYGESTPALIRMVNDLGYGAFRWTVDTLGWKGAAAGQTPSSVKARVVGALRPGAIVLMHCGSAEDGSTLDADALPAVIAAVRQRGYDFVALP